MGGPPEKTTRRTELPKDDVEWFDSNYQQHGAWTWFISTCLARFRELHEQTPEDLLDLSVASVHEEIEEDED